MRTVVEGTSNFAPVAPGYAEVEHVTVPATLRELARTTISRFTKYHNRGSIACMLILAVLQNGDNCFRTTSLIAKWVNTEFPELHGKTIKHILRGSTGLQACFPELVEQATKCFMAGIAPDFEIPVGAKMLDLLSRAKKNLSPEQFDLCLKSAINKSLSTRELESRISANYRTQREKNLSATKQRALSKNSGVDSPHDTIIEGVDHELERVLRAGGDKILIAHLAHMGMKQRLASDLITSFYDRASGLCSPNDRKRVDILCTRTEVANQLLSEAIQLSKQTKRQKHLNVDESASTIARIAEKMEDLINIANEGPPTSDIESRVQVARPRFFSELGGDKP